MMSSLHAATNTWRKPDACVADRMVKWPTIIVARIYASLSGYGRLRKKKMVLRKNLYFAALVIAIGLLLVHHNLQPVQHIDTVDDAGRSFVIGSQGLSE